MRIHAAIIEALLSLKANRGRNAAVALGLCFCITAPAYLEMRQGQIAVEAYLDGIASGNGVVVALRESGQDLDADVCLSQERDFAVLHSGTVSQGGLVAMSASPGLILQVARYGGNYLRVVDPTFAGGLGGISIGSTGARELGIAEGGYLDSPATGLVEISEIVRPGSRAPAQARWIYQPDDSAEGAQECWLEARPGMRAEVIDVLRAQYAQVEDLRVTTPVALASEDTVSDWDDRATRFIWLPFAFTAGLLFFLVSLPRRAEVGLRLSLGASRRAVLVQLYLESFTLSLLVVGSSVLWLLLISVSMGGQSVPWLLGLLVAQQVACAYLFLTALVASWLVSRNVFSSLRSK